MENSEDESEGARRGVAGRLARFARKHFVGVSFVLICVLGGPLADNLSDWHGIYGTPPPWHFSVLTFNAATGAYGEEQYGMREELAEMATANKGAYTYLLPEGAAKRYPFPPDKDAYFSVERVSAGEQIVTYGYETAVFGHGFSTYRAFADRVEPIEAGTRSVVTYMLLFVVWMIVVAIDVLARMLWSIARRLQRD